MRWSIAGHDGYRADDGSGQTSARRGDAVLVDIIAPLIGFFGSDRAHPTSSQIISGIVCLLSGQLETYR